MNYVVNLPLPNVTTDPVRWSVEDWPICELELRGPKIHLEAALERLIKQAQSELATLKAIS